MGADRTDSVLGMWKWPAVAGMFALQLYILCNPPAWLGGVVLPIVVGLSTASENILRVMAGENLLGQPMVDSISLWSVGPLAIIFMVILFASRSAVTRAIRPFTQNEDDARKFGECAVRVVYYGLMWSVAMYLGEMEGFWPDVSQCWVQLRNGQPRSIFIEATYIIELAYYTGGILVHLLIDQPLKDFWVMLIHHIVTIMLICMSYDLGVHRIGVVLLLLHNISDVFLDSAKCFHYVGLDILSTATFINLIISWIMYRLFYYPLMIYQAAVYDVWEAEKINNMKMPMYNLFLGLLLSLLVLHYYWFYLILKVAERTMKDGIEDVRDETALKKVEKVE